ncbi:spore germination protein [Paenibacillus rigui]|uniref:Spore germination protein n=1 Tax=Paenibacillus rigui TaxID=554312 RepID=A0A229ULK7_9BACL|nr:spore germination protein [Paenibacillus rigui]OXM84338.1 hypothetical protein CF651_21390 [Paenibacillus rigui]
MPDDNQLSKELHINMEAVKNVIGHSPDVVFRLFRTSGNSRQALLIYIDGLADKSTIKDHILGPLMRVESGASVSASESWERTVVDSIMSVSEVKEVRRLDGWMHYSSRGMEAGKRRLGGSI